MKRTFSLLCVLLLSFGCGDDTAPTTDGGGVDAPIATEPTCMDVCAAATNACGAEPPNCLAGCAAFSAAAKRCVVAASSCVEVQGCGGATDDAGPTPDAGTTSDAGPVECTLGEVAAFADCPAPSPTCSSANINDTIWCSPVCTDSSDCEGFACNTAGYCVPQCTSGNRTCPAPFTDCEVAFGATDGYCR